LLHLPPSLILLAPQDKYQQRLAELEMLDRLNEAEQQQQQHQQQQANTAAAADSGGWFSQLLGSISISGSSAKQQKELTPQQKARRAAAARHAQVFHVSGLLVFSCVSGQQCLAHKDQDMQLWQGCIYRQLAPAFCGLNVSFTNTARLHIVGLRLHVQCECVF
jgi:hypothetical protein